VTLSGPCWEAVCPVCKKVNGTVWRKKALGKAPRGHRVFCGWCEDITPCQWEGTIVQPVGHLGRMSGFSGSESDFTPHFNTATGKFVRSLAEMKHLQARHGLTDVVVKGKAQRFIPGDWLTRPDRERREAEKAGVRVKFGE